MENTEIKVNTWKHERAIVVEGLTSYELAARNKESIVLKNGPALAKVKIFARNDNTWDVVAYKVVTAGQKVLEVPVKATATEQPVHGQKSKDRKKPFVSKKFSK